MTYRDIVIEGEPASDAPHSPPRLPDEYMGEYLSCIPKIPLPNKSYVFYVRAAAPVIDRLGVDQRVAPQIIAHSWTELFFSSYRYWDWVFDADVTAVIDGDECRMRRKLAQVSLEHIHGIYVPGVFAGDETPHLQLPAFIVDRYHRMRADTQLIIPAIRGVNEQLIRYLQAHPHKLHHLRPRQFEELICEILTRFGWSVELTPESKDGGYDIVGVSGSVGGVQSSWIIECKKYAPYNKVGVGIVRALCGVKEQIKVANAMIVTTSTFTKGATEMATKRWDLSLRDQEEVLKWVSNASAT